MEKLDCGEAYQSSIKFLTYMAEYCTQKIIKFDQVIAKTIKVESR